MEQNKTFDAIIIGGSYAGLAAGLALGRSMRKVLIIDSGRPANRQTPHSHNFLTRDGITPAELSAIARAEVLQYPTVEMINDRVETVNGSDHNFLVATSSGAMLHTKKILFTTGIKDQMPDISGFADCWGISAIHCPYCHGYEYRGQNTGILINGDHAIEFADLIRNWTDQLIIFTNGEIKISLEHQQQIAKLNIQIVDKQIIQIEHDKGYMTSLVFKDGSKQNLNALYARLPFDQHSKIPADMGCDITTTGYIFTDEFQKTSLPGVYAAGDNTSMMRSVAGAVAAGSKAGAMLNRELIG